VIENRFICFQLIEGNAAFIRPISMAIEAILRQHRPDSLPKMGDRPRICGLNSKESAKCNRSHES
jgi:hypothetical protein